MANELFSKVQVQRPARNLFNLSNINRMSADFGALYPIKVLEVYPGDSWRLQTSGIIRLQPLVNPTMTHIDVDIRYFFVPNRLVMDAWEDFITGGIDGNSTAVKPYIKFAKSTNYYNNSIFGVGTLFDYFGVNFPNSSLSNAVQVDMIPFKSYMKIFNDWYMDELLDTEFDLKTNEQGEISNGSDYVLKYRRFRKDYFTSARPNAQLGDPVVLPFTGNADIVSTGTFQLTAPAASSFSSGNKDIIGNRGLADDETNKTLGLGIVSSTTGVNLALEYRNGLAVDLSHVNATTIEELRRAVAAEQWKEKNSRGGNRYIENILMHFGVKSSDARLQRSQYIGGSSSPVVISDVEQTAVDTDSPVGTLAGKGTAVLSGRPCDFFAEEHGWIIGLMSLLPKVGYEQGLHRSFQRFDKLDYMWPEFAHIGEQAISNNEIFMGEIGDFGYAPRYAELMSAFDEVHGDFKTSLSTWVQNRRFASLPSLNSTFIGTENSLSSLNEIFAVTDISVNHFECELANSALCLRMLPKYQRPGLLSM